MSWIQNLITTYNSCYDNPSFIGEEHELLPTDHVAPQAHVEITISSDGDFRSAEFIGKQSTLLPVTQESAGRTNSPVPHGLSDSIQYLALDYVDRGGGKKSAYDQFIQQLSDWCDSRQAHPKAIAVRDYLTKGTLISDLANSGIYKLDAAGQFVTAFEKPDSVPDLLRTLGKEKGQYKDPGSALIRWRVESAYEKESRCWKDKSLQQSWCNYVASNIGNTDLCFATGETTVPGTNHPKYIRRPGDGAKLVSTPSSGGLFTYKGRFATPEQACTLGWIASQKAHNALRWLIARQGYKNGEQVIVSWEINGTPTPKLLDSTLSAFELEMAEMGLDPIMDNDSIDDGDAGQYFSKQLNKKIQGYRSNLKPDATIVTLALEAATTGRLSIAFYRALAGSDFFDRIELWHQQFSWKLRVPLPDPNKPKKTITHWLFSAPAPRDIAEAAYGSNLDEKLKKTTIERILPCIIDGAQIPRDIMESVVRKTSNRAAFKKDDHWKWEKALGIACALYKGYSARNPEKTEEYTMKFDLDNKSRNYLYGCLLAVAENIEDFALGKSEEKRPTNAERQMQRFSQRPYNTWLNIENAIKPYCNRLRNTHSGFINNRQKWLDDIHSHFEGDSYTDDSPLAGEYLLGYHCLRRHLLQKKDTEQVLNPAEGEV